MTRGVLYVAVNEGIQTYLHRSILSVHTHCPDLPICIVSDLPDLSLYANRFMLIPSRSFDDPGFENLTHYPDFGYYAKVKYFYSSPYEETLFLDHDTCVLADIHEIFDVLEGGKFDFMATHDVGTTVSKDIPDQLPLVFPNFNTGVVAYRKSDKTEKLMRDWWENMKALRNPWGDQPSFVKAVYSNPDIRFCVMPRAYNYRFNFPQHAYEYVKILHGRAENASLEEIGASINSHAGGPHFTAKGKTIGHYDLSSGEIAWT